MSDGFLFQRSCRLGAAFGLQWRQQAWSGEGGEDDDDDDGNVNTH